MTSEDIVIEAVEDWLEVTINRPAKMNTLRELTAQEILATLEDAESDRNVHAVVFKGNEKAFCAGIDTSEFSVAQNEYFDFYRKRKRSRKVNELYRRLCGYTKPILSAVEGIALGGGFELALIGDIMVAGENATFGLPEIRLGMMPGGGGTQTLTRLVGPALAKELIWTGRRITAREAHAYRLVNHVTQSGQAIDKVRELCRTISANAPLSVMLTKSAIDRGVDLPMAEGMATEGDLSFLLYFAKDRQEGLNAFREKRAPKFSGE